MIGEVHIIVSGAAVLSLLNIGMFIHTRFKNNNGVAHGDIQEIRTAQKFCVECLQKLSDNAIRQTAILESIASRIE